MPRSTSGARGRRAFSLDRVASERARGRDYWFYNGGRPAGGAITIDAPATDPRATIWAAFKHDVRVYFYWHSVHWRHNSQKDGERNQNVWADSITFDNRKQAEQIARRSGIHSRRRRADLSGRGAPAPGRGSRHRRARSATIQLANFRRGLQDHQYLTLARAAWVSTPSSTRRCRDRAAGVLRRRGAGQLSGDRRPLRGGAREARARRSRR